MNSRVRKGPFWDVMEGRIVRRGSNVAFLAGETSG